MITQSSATFKRLLDRCLAQRLPAIGSAHGGLPQGHKGKISLDSVFELDKV